MTERIPFMTVKELGEQGLLQLLHQFCPAHLIGDDAAVIKPSVDHELVMTTDVLVDGVHFSDRTTPPEAVGWRAAAVNLSDLAAMGAKPIGVTVGLGLPPETQANWIEQVYQGLQNCLSRFDALILGGDVVRSPQVFLSITAMGELRPEQKILRSKAQPGDVIVVTGHHGCSRAGLELLLNPQWEARLADVFRQALIKKHQKPIPRLDVSDYLRSHQIPAAGMDSSDGLADAILQICRASHVGAKLNADAITVHPALASLQSVSEKQRLDWMLYGGEDFELVLTLKPHHAQALIKELGDGAAIIGEVIPEPGVIMRWNGEEISLEMESGFQHWQA